MRIPKEMGFHHFKKRISYDKHVSSFFVQTNLMTPFEGNPLEVSWPISLCPEGIFISWWNKAQQIYFDSAQISNLLNLLSSLQTVDVLAVKMPALQKG